MGWFPFVAAQYPNAHNVNFGDSYIGVMAPGWWRTLEQNWDVLNAFYPGIPGMDLNRLRQCSTREDGECEILQYIVAQQAKYFPDSVVSTYTYNADAVQIAFSALGGAPSLRWTEVMRLIVPSALEAPNAAIFIGSGASHCLGNSIYSKSEEGVTVVDWVAAMINGEPYQQRVDCCGEGVVNATTSRDIRPSDVPRDDPTHAGCAWAFTEYYDSLGLARPGPNATRAEEAKILSMWEAFDCANFRRQ
jgi:hypothetical protein